ncbi:MAG: lipopolysaccharide biosynthesis protein [Lachnospiraceae bacterium]|nr:lipopolysaccharide biosynthesis protein [Lachnospiraceae bacterium]
MKEQKNSKHNILSSFIWKFGERILAQVVSLVISIILARLLTPEDYGVVALVMIFITIANVFVSSGLGNALIQKKEVDNIDFSSVFFVNIIISIIIYLILFALAPTVANFFDMPAVCLIIRVLGLRIIIAAINSVQQAYVSRNMLFKKFFWSTLGGTLVSGLLGVGMAYKGYGVWALVVQYLANTCVDTVILWFTVRWRPEMKFSWLKAKGLISYGWKLLLSSLLDTGYRQVRSLIIGKFYTSSDLAFYNQGEKYPSLIVTNINTSIGSVIFPVMAQNQNNREEIKRLTRKVIRTSSYIMWPTMIGFSVCAESLVRLILTEKWLPCVPYISIFCLSYGFWPIHTANLQAINAMGRSDIFLKLEIIKKTLGIILLLFTIKQGPLAIALSLIVVDIISLFVNSYPNKNLLGYGYVEQIKDVIPTLLLTIAMAIIIYPIKYIINFDWLIICTQVVFGIIVYLILSLKTEQDVLKYFFDLLKQNKK